MVTDIFKPSPKMTDIHNRLVDMTERELCDLANESPDTE